MRALKPPAQLRELFDRLDLAGRAQPFRLRLSCNAPLRRIGPSQAAARVPPGVLERHMRFVTCDICWRVFWEGSHWRRMRTLIDSVSRPVPPSV